MGRRMSCDSKTSSGLSPRRTNCSSRSAQWPSPRADCATREANRKSGRAVSRISRSISGLRRPRRRYRAIVDRRYPLEGVVEASRYVETEQKVGNVILTVNGAPGPIDSAGSPVPGSRR
jgi:hypothetical protein